MCPAVAQRWALANLTGKDKKRKGKEKDAQQAKDPIPANPQRRAKAKEEKVFTKAPVRKGKARVKARGHGARRTLPVFCPNFRLSAL